MTNIFNPKALFFYLKGIGRCLSLASIRARCSSVVSCEQPVKGNKSSEMSGCFEKMNEKKTSEWLQVKGQEKILANGTCEVSGCLMFFSVTPHVCQ